MEARKIWFAKRKHGFSGALILDNSISKGMEAVKGNRSAARLNCYRQGDFWPARGYPKGEKTGIMPEAPLFY
jgi:hypothetical protein